MSEQNGIRPPVSELNEPAGGEAGVDEGAEKEEKAEEVFDAVDPEVVAMKVLPSPQRPSMREVEEHSTCHLPYRSWCPICVKARGKEDDHGRCEVRKDRKPVVVMDYKSLGASLEEEGDAALTAIVMRHQETGMIAGHLVQKKGVSDDWIVEKLVDDISSWGLTDIVLKTDGEPAIVALMDAIREKRKHETIPSHSPAYSPQSNGVAERAVQEFTAQLRALKLALEARIKVPVNSNWTILVSLAEHANYLINRCLRGADGKTPMSRLKGHEGNRPMVEMGEQVWAKPMRTRSWSRTAALDSRWVGGTWCGINAKTGEHLVILEGGRQMMRVRTVKRRPIEERWSAEAIAEVEVSVRRPEAGK